MAFISWKRVPVAELLDVVAPFIFVAMAFGRLGCVLNGCCFGGLCAPDSGWGLCFPKKVTGAHLVNLHEGRIATTPVASLPVYPVQLMEAGFNFLLCGLLWWYLRGVSPRGSCIPLASVFYGVGRFVLEHLRGDKLPIYWGGWTISQVVSLLLVGVFLPVFVVLTLANQRCNGPRPRIKHHHEGPAPAAKIIPCQPPRHRR
jgi:phosphatidylglycerol:prolipoprotein diacylglycerol transferase